MISNRSLKELTRKVSWLMVGLLALCGAVGIGSALLLRSAIVQQENAGSLLRNHMTADMMHDAVRGDVLAILAARDPALQIDARKARQDLADHLQQFREAMAAASTYQDSQPVSAAAAKVAKPLQAYADSALTISNSAARDPAAAAAALPQFFTSFEELEAEMEQVTNIIEGYAESRSRNATWMVVVAKLLILLSMAMAILIAWRVTAAVNARLIAPLAELAGAIERMAEGDRSTAVAGSERGDELGMLARGMEAFRVQLEAAEQAKAAQSQLIVDSIGNGLSALACGDLGKPVTSTLEAPFARLKSDFNAAISSLGGIVGEVRDSAVVLRMSAREIAEANGEIARRTERNAASLDETTNALDEIDRHVRDTASTASETVAVANTGMETLASGRGTADMAVTAMSRVSESAQGIDAVIEGLDKIAFQTRVLAMNAAVEAGRAGEAGRGFAVVADLVSALAMRAEEEAKRARAQLTTTQSDIGDAVEAVRSVDQALHDIAASVGAVNGRIGGIAAANERQATLIGQIREAIRAMNETAQQSAAMIEESAAAAQQLTAQAELLEEASGRFTLGNEQGRPVKPSRPAIRLAA
ncbi:methyl-accepting chemotaxis protein [Sphingomonas sp. LHG3406-1]|uniref:methyl-accepting chemotaxis protein n=1 Tax=Sphingomonas sp. LHG3406-1 TaxID=2804617 RepID=UPI00261CE9E5|nr:methyl-accepting chemotaxis protein [Sphingomonas sp. LHG3406-1]